MGSVAASFYMFYLYMSVIAIISIQASLIPWADAREGRVPSFVIAQRQACLQAASFQVSRANRRKFKAEASNVKMITQRDGRVVEREWCKGDRKLLFRRNVPGTTLVKANICFQTENIC